MARDLRRLRQAGAWILVVACLVVGWRYGHEPARELRIAAELHAAVIQTNRTQLLDLPLRSDAPRGIRWLSHLRPMPGERYAIATRLDDAARGSSSLRANEAAAVANLLAGDAATAASHLERVDPRHRDTALWTNLAVAHVVAALPDRDRDHLLSAIAAADRAIARPEPSQEALYARALALETLRVRPAASKAWLEYAARDSGSPWSKRARKHHAALARQRDDAAAWNEAMNGKGPLTDDAIVRLSVTYPQQARTYAESVYLAEWADAVQAGDVDAASGPMRRVRLIARTLGTTTGESFLTDVLAGIDETVSRGEQARIRQLAAAFITYRRGRLAIRDRDAGTASVILGAASEMFARANNPMAAMAECHRAVALIDENRPVEARRRLVNLIAESATRSRYKALTAFALYHIALCDAGQGDWSEALQSAANARERFRQLGERGLAGTVESLMSQAFAFLGQERLAWTHGLEALALLDRAGDRGRVRVTVAGLSRTELRHARWEQARALIGVEGAVAAGRSAPVDDADMLLRLAAAEFRLGDRRASDVALDRARAAASSTKEPIRSKLFADIAGVAGSIARRTRPEFAISLLGSAISFELSAQRAILLPQLYLERGRAQRALARSDAAADDFEEGIRRLELQRSRTAEAELRPGIFDGAADLFDEAVSLSLDRRDVARAFRYVERGRARAVVEEIRAKEQQPSADAGQSIDTVRGSLPRGALLIEYAVLDHRLAIFTLDHDGLTVTVVPASANALQQRVQVLMNALAERRSLPEVQLAAGTTYDLLLKPVAAKLRDASVLIIVPDSSLQQIPFAVLFDGLERRYLIEQCPVITAPGAIVFAESARRLARFEKKQVVTAAIFADPSVDFARFGELPTLPGAEIEARSIARYYPRSSVASRREATIDRFRATASSADLIHYSGHAVTRPAEPWQSALLFAPANGNDGALSARQIADMSFPNTRLAVIASCSSLRGHTAGIEGVPSVARAFLIAGVPTVIGTLWDIDDEDSAMLMRRLHDGLVHGLSATDALRAMQISALRGSVAELQHPAQWAAFAVLGADTVADQGGKARSTSSAKAI